MAEEQNKQISDETEDVVLRVQFGTAILIVTFVSGSIYDGRRLAIKGEALSWGFDAYPVSMRWGKPFEDEEISEFAKKQLMDIIIKDNSKNPTGFHLIVNW